MLWKKIHILFWIYQESSIFCPSKWWTNVLRLVIKRNIKTRVDLRIDSNKTNLHTERMIVWFTFRRKFITKGKRNTLNVKLQNNGNLIPLPEWFINGHNAKLIQVSMIFEFMLLPRRRESIRGNFGGDHCFFLSLSYVTFFVWCVFTKVY